LSGRIKEVVAILGSNVAHPDDSISINRLRGTRIPGAFPYGSKKIIDACHHDSFSILGTYQDGNDIVVRAHIPHVIEGKIAEGE